MHPQLCSTAHFQPQLVLGVFSHPGLHSPDPRPPFVLTRPGCPSAPRTPLPRSIPTPTGPGCANTPKTTFPRPLSAWRCPGCANALMTMLPRHLFATLRSRCTSAPRPLFYCSCLVLGVQATQNSVPSPSCTIISSAMQIRALYRLLHHGRVT